MSDDSKQIRVLTVDDHPILRQGIAALIADESDITLVAEAANGREAIQQFRAHRPDGSPTEATATVVRLSPAIYGTARVGVQIAEPSENWTRLFVSWVADEQAATPGES